MPATPIRNNNVIYYHPLDSFTEYTHGIDWIGDPLIPGIVGPSGMGLTTVGTASIITFDSIFQYPTVNGVEHFASAFWTSGLFTDSKQGEVYIDFGVSYTSRYNSLGIIRTPANSFVPQVFVEMVGQTGVLPIPSYPIDNGIHFVVIDIQYQPASSGWRQNISIDGSGWQNLGIDNVNATPLLHDQFRIEYVTGTPTGMIVDEVVTWSGHTTFTNQELSNLYELHNTYNQTMNEYSAFFPSTINNSIDHFTHGKQQISDNISLYIPGQKDVKSTDFFIEGYIQNINNIDLYISGSPRTSSSSIDMYLKVIAPSSGGTDLYISGPMSNNNNIDHFIYGKQISSNDISQYIHGEQSNTGNISLSIAGAIASSSLFNLYIMGPLQSANSLNDIITGHASQSGNMPFFMRSGLDIYGFIAVSDNSPSGTTDLFIHGIPTGPTSSFYINDTSTLFISNDGSAVESQSILSAFMKVDNPILIPSSGIWQSFLKGGNSANNDISMYMNSHASGENPFGTSANDSFDLFIDGQSIQTGDQGLLSNGYFVKSVNVTSFAKVHLGTNHSADFYVSGAINTVFPSRMSSLYIFGISGIVTDSRMMYAKGKELVNNNNDMSIFGIQGISSGVIPLYMQVTTLGSFNISLDFYTHGF